MPLRVRGRLLPSNFLWYGYQSGYQECASTGRIDSTTLVVGASARDRTLAQVADQKISREVELDPEREKYSNFERAFFNQDSTRNKSEVKISSLITHVVKEYRGLFWK